MCCGALRCVVAGGIEVQCGAVWCSVMQYGVVCRSGLEGGDNE